VQLAVSVNFVAYCGLLYEGGLLIKVGCTRQDVVKIELSRATLNSNPFLLKTKYTAVSTKHHKPRLFLVLHGDRHGTWYGGTV
jgi:hypothetical protein